MAGAELVKLKIIPYKDKNYSSKSGTEFEALINPANYSHNFTIEYNDSKSIGDTSSTPKFEKYSPETISFKIVVDNTGVVSTKSTKDVNKQIADLKKTVYSFNGSIHEPNFVQVVWGGMIFNGRLTSMKVDYVLFKPNGIPLRANVDISFKRFTSSDVKAKKAKKSSPDLSHFITVKAGDTLPNLCNEIYKNSLYCADVAKINKLKSFRNLEPGTQLLFPPIEKYGK